MNTQPNNCDGCQKGIPVKNGMHRMGAEGKYPDFMSCTKERYEQAEKKCANCSEKHPLYVMEKGNTIPYCPSCGANPPSSLDERIRKEFAFYMHEEGAVKAGMTIGNGWTHIADFFLSILHRELAEQEAETIKQERKRISDSLRYKLQKATGTTQYHKGWKDGLRAGIDFANPLFESTPEK